MQIHSVANRTIEAQIEELKKQYVKPVRPDPFVDPIKEFSRASRMESMVRNWLTYPVQERKRLVKEVFTFIPRYTGDEREGVAPETDEHFNDRQLERWRALLVVLQEESRAPVGVRSTEVAIGAFKQLFPDYDWRAKPPEQK